MQRIKAAALGVWERLARQKEANLFLALALCTGLAMACIVPPFQECDGWTHYLLATEVSYGNLFSPVADRPTHKAGMLTVPGNLNDIDYHLIQGGTGEGGEYIRYLKGVELSEQKGEIGLPGRFVSLYYYPQALGLWLGRTLKMSVYWSVFLSRALNLFLYLALAYRAVGITPVLKNSMAAVAMLPITLYQAASDSPDAMQNGLCFLFVAVCLFYAYGEKEHLGWKEACGMGALLGVIFLYKYVYVCLGLLAFLIPARKFGEKKNYWKCAVIALIPLLALGAIGMGNAVSMANAGQAVAEAGGMAQTQYLMAHPLFIFRVVLGTFLHKFNDYMLMLNILGSLNYPLMGLQFIVPLFLVFAACIDVNQTCLKIKWKDKALCLAAVLMVGAGLVLAMYIGEGRGNEVGAQVAEGVQGRYFIPIILPLFVAVQQQGAQGGVKYVTEKILGIMGLILLCTLYILHMYCF